MAAVSRNDDAGGRKSEKNEIFILFNVLVTFMARKLFIQQIVSLLLVFFVVKKIEVFKRSQTVKNRSSISNMFEGYADKKPQILFLFDPAASTFYCFDFCNFQL